MASSNGLLLCNTDTKEFRHYVVLNPVTKECDKLPEAPKPFKYVAMAFICKRNPRRLNRVDYQIVRAGVSNPKKCTTALEIETFSSVTGKWKESTIICASPFYLCVSNVPAFVYGELICWRDIRCLIIAYNPTKETVELMNLPGDAQNYISWSEHLGQSEGKIQYARCDDKYVEIWVLENFKAGEWIMKYQVAISKIHPDKDGMRGGLGIEGFHPTKGHQILITWLRFRFWCNLESEKLEIITGEKEMKTSNYFVYEWPGVNQNF